MIGGRPAEGADDLLSAISEGTLILAIVALAVLAIVQRKPGLAVLSFVVVGGSLAVTEILKLELLTRPLLAPSAVLDNSFPSGHTTIGIAVGLALLLVVPPRLRPLTGVGAAVLAASIGIATVAAGWHRPSDAIAAYLVAVGVASAATAAMLRWAPAAAPGPGEESSPLTRIGFGIDEAVVGIFVLGGAGLLLLALLRAEGVPWASAGVGFLLSAAAIAAIAAGVVLALLVALGRIRPAASGAQAAGASPTQ